MLKIFSALLLESENRQNCSNNHLQMFTNGCLSKELFRYKKEMKNLLGPSGELLHLWNTKTWHRNISNLFEIWANVALLPPVLKSYIVAFICQMQTNILETAKKINDSSPVSFFSEDLF